MKESNKTSLVVGLIVAALVAGAAIWLITMNDDETTQNVTTTDNTTEPMVEQETRDIVALAIDTEPLSTLVTAVQAAELVETLQGVGPYTVFAPTNEAFDNLPDGTLDTLLEPENQSQLADVLTYHVVPAEVYSTDLSDGQVVQTVLGEDLTIEIDDGAVYIVDASGGRAMVTTADVEASNGVVHIIDSVLLTQ